MCLCRLLSSAVSPSGLICGKFAHHIIHGRNHAFDAASALQINKGKAVSHKVIAHVHNVRFWEKDDAVSVGVPAGEMQRTDVFPIQMHGDIVIECDDWQSI